MTDLLSISRGEPGDVVAVMPVMHAAFDHRFGEAWTAGQCIGVLALPQSALLIAEKGDRVVGFSLSRTVLDETELLMIAVDPDARNQGIGRALIEATMDHARSLGAKTLFLEVRDGNPAIALYKSVAFIQVGHRSRYYRGIDGEYFDALTLSRKINPD